MLEQTILSLELPYRDPLDVRAFCFGLTADRRPLATQEELRDLSPRLCVVSGLRGDEIQQTLACSMLVEHLSELEGRGMMSPGNLVMVIPCVNTASMGVGSRFWLADGSDINRAFPGSATGTTTERIAHGVFECVRAFRYGVHLSSFYLEGDFQPHIRVMHGPGETANHGADFGLPYVTHYQPGPNDTTTLHYNWRSHGTEAYTLYTRQTAVANEGAAKDAVRSVLRFMSARDPLIPAPHGGYRAFELAERSLVPVEVPMGGVCCPRVQVGDVVQRGQTLALVRDLMRGSVLAELEAPCDGVVFYQARRPLVNEQTMAFQIVPLDTRSAVEGEPVDRAAWQ